MLNISDRSRPAEGWHSSASGATYHVLHLGQITAIKTYAEGEVTAENQLEKAGHHRAEAQRSLAAARPHPNDTLQPPK